MKMYLKLPIPGSQINSAPYSDEAESSDVWGVLADVRSFRWTRNAGSFSEDNGHDRFKPPIYITGQRKI